MSRSQRLVPLITAFGLCLTPIAENLILPHPLKAQIQEGMELKLRRSQNGIEVVIEGVGQEPVLEQRHKGQSWEGRLRTKGQPGLRTGPHQQLSRPDLGLKYLSLSGSGESYQLSVVAVEGRQLTEPVVSTDGRNLILSFPGVDTKAEQIGRLDLQTPGRVPQDAYAPPLRQRAVAPPLGDMAVGTMVLSNRSFVQVSGPPVTLTLNNAPAKDALMSLARLGGYGFIFVGDDSDSEGTTGEGISADAQVNGGNRKVSMAFQSESYARALNGVLLASGLQGKLDGRTLLVGSTVASKTFGPQVSKVYRLNQASASSAADYLASLGASISKVNVLSVAGEIGSASTGITQPSNQTSETNNSISRIETYGASIGPLRGLTGVTDSRLQTITLVGDSKLITVAESYLKQIDLRSRQVALSVKILDVNLDNVKGMDNSFSLRFGNNLIVNDQGKLLAAFGRNLPANEGTFSSAPVETESGVSTTTTQVVDYGLMYYVDSQGFSTGIVETDDEGKTVKAEGMQYNPDGSVATNGGRGPIYYDVTTAESSTTPAAATRTPNPSLNYPDQAFYDFLQAQIVSSNTKIMASPTLILSESSESIPGEIGRGNANEAFVRLGDKVVTAFSVTSDDNGNIFCEPTFETAGLSLGAMVSKIDDNGFVTFTLEPNLSAEVGEPVRQGECGDIKTVNERMLETGAVRVRDGQTLILTGVISDADSDVVTKWPILGDIPVIGQFFRASTRTKKKSELVIMVTPRIINDEQGATYGYGYRPSTSASRNLIYRQ
ncbi:putative type II secretion system protein D precursor [Prochlorococcus marinus str. MIT 1318]|uniref:general secretion pathway protein GspD n=1 Tax=Prochlorococcus TaxID=1218 RepID=UPI0007B39716|nr:general secretion pathway protein GspD [Prochlorococcus marinus]KZR71034.1 putative type II secretion system protein D precursor [Prochlorococcus marinus str. MIT 1318]